MTRSDHVSRVEMFSRLNRAVNSAGSQKALAEQLGVSPAYLSAVLNAKKPPSDRVLSHIGLRVQAVYVEHRYEERPA